MIILLVGSLSFFTIIVKAQNYTAIQDAFASSYTSESAGQYTAGVEALKTVYSETSYEINLRLGWLSYLAGSFTESAAYYQKAMKLMPLSIEAKMGYVLPVYAMGNVDQVKAQYLEILKIDPCHPVVNYRLGSILYGKGEYVAAEKYFEKGADLYPFDFDTLLMYGWTELKLGKYREAQVLFNKALMNKPKNASALEGLGQIK